MGNHRFRLSDMMPNAWFYKLRDMSKGSRGQSIPHSMKSRNHHLPKSSSPTTLNPFPQTPPLQLKQAYLPNRPSYYYSTSTREETEHRPPCSPLHPKTSDTHFPTEPPRKSTRKVRRKPTKRSTKLVTSSVSAGCSCRAWKSETVPDRSEDFTDDDLRKPIITDHLDLDGTESSSQSCSCRLTSSATDIIIDMASNKKNSKSSSSQVLDHFKDLDEASELELPPILTKPSRKEDQQAKKDDNKIASTEEQSKSTPRWSPPGIHRLRLRTNSPRLVSRRLQAHRARKSSAGMQQRRGLAESFAVVKPSSDPQRDFRDSMVEMIVENNIRASKDLEELLACYLSLNSNEYHDIIIKVFEQIWFDLTDIRL